MNIFFTDKCPIKCAQYLDDKRVIKMTLETAQMLSTALREHGCDIDILYKTTHKNHPSNIWIRQTKSNYKWALEHFDALCNEFENRRGKTHKSSTLRQAFVDNMKYIPDGPLTELPNCAARADLNISYKHVKDTFLAYKLYLADRWELDVLTPKWYGV